MAKKDGKLAIRDLDEIMKETLERNEKPLVYHDLEIKVKTYLNIGESISFVNSVLASATANDVYYPSLFDLAFKINVITYFTNITVPTNPEKCNDLVNGTKLYNAIIEIGDLKTYIDKLEKSCREQLEINKENKPNDIINLIKNVVEKNEERMEGIDIKETVDILKPVANADTKQIAEAIIELHNKNTDKK
jgi:hypothetical protein